jgi:PAT family beta-lactamase induction signal transducer AmpG
MSNLPVGDPDRHRLGIIALLGVVSGLPLLLTSSTLTSRMTLEGIDMATIGFFAWVHWPYTFKFLWAPLLDRYRLPFLGRRRGWMLCWQVLIALGIAALGVVEPKGNINLLFMLGLMVATFSASLDIVVDAYRTEVLEPDERGPGAAFFITGYRAAIVLSGAAVLVLADHMPWRMAYFLVAGVMLATVIVTLVAAPSEEVPGSPKTMREAVWPPLKDLATRKNAAYVFLFLLLFKLGERTASHLIHPFLLETGFSLSAVGTINKGVGLPAAIAGTILGGYGVTRFGVRRSLLVFGVLQAAPNLLYAYQHQVGADHGLLALVVIVDQFCNGMATAALVVLLMSLCDRRYTAFQYAALMALTSVLGLFASGWSGVIQEAIGWPWFFAASALGTAPALLILLFLPAEIGAPTENSVIIESEE